MEDFFVCKYIRQTKVSFMMKVKVHWAKRKKIIPFEVVNSNEWKSFVEELD